MENKKILLASPHMSDEGYERQFVKEAFDTNWIAPLGPNVTAFENEVASLLGVKHAVALVSGTAAIHMALIAADVKEGDIVLCQSLTFSATANPIIYQKAIPVFIDSDYETWNMSSVYLEQALIKYPNAKAVIVVHLYGMSADMDPIVALCKEYKVTLIEDAAESLGTTYKGKYTGTFGDYGILSFNGNKIITTSGGGMLLSNNEERIQKVRYWSTQARDQARHYQHSELGYNYRMSNISAGIGRGQLKVLDKRVTKKREIFFRYQQKFKDINDISFMPLSGDSFSNCWLSSIILHGKVTPLDIILELEKNKIESRPLWKPMHMQPFFEKFDFVGSNISSSLFSKGLCLPSDTKMYHDEQDHVINLIRSIFNR
jgi:dTDP-4-amino-4,6-dideoxygalactose transaminase